MTSSTVKLLMAAGIAGAAMPQNLSAKEIILEGGDNAETSAEAATELMSSALFMDVILLYNV